MPGTLAIVITFTALATVAVALRLFTRLFMARTAGWDDGLMVLALVTMPLRSGTAIGLS